MNAPNRDLTQNWIVGNSVEQPQWESGNSSVAFPFKDDSLPANFPTDMIVDACIVVPCENNQSSQPVILSCLHMSPAMVSAVVTVDGVPQLHCHVLASSFNAFTPVKLESVSGEYSGFITFGDLRFDTILTIRQGIPFAESVVIRPVVGRLKKFVQPGSGNEATGTVGIELPPGISMSISNSEHTSIVQFNADDTIRRNTLHPCFFDMTPNGMPVPITSINGVKPDKYGRLALVFASKEEEVPK